ncbi:monooxygenase [Acetobacter pasteurianus NBRC 101655]|nr:monooxygenase [Acetobacter pasteurianus NBRC 101655]CCT58380.1 dibenzothiophene sulfone monooxygenase [Acetobacter pasteurianus 386B]
MSIRDQAKLQGRRAEEPLIFSLLTIITAPTREAAWKKYEDYKQYISLEGALTLLSGWTGVDFSQYELDEPIRHVRNDAINSAIDSLTILNPDKIWTVGELARHAAIGGMGVTIVGSPTEIADQMEAWMEETGIDGFNLAYAVAPETFEDIVDLIIPELQRRGRYKTAYQPGTLRNKLFGCGDRLDNAHIGG